MKCVVNDDVVLSRPLEGHCQRTSLRSRSGHVMRVMRMPLIRVDVIGVS